MSVLPVISMNEQQFVDAPISAIPPGMQQSPKMLSFIEQQLACDPPAEVPIGTQSQFPPVAVPAQQAEGLPMSG
jgi:hypothetical protein